MINTIDLSGEWAFFLDGDKTGIENRIFSQTLNDTIPLPGTTSMAKKGVYSDKKEIGSLTDPYLFEGYAWYSKEITLPSEYVGKNIVLHLERTRMTKVWVNDLPAGEYDSLTTPHEYNLTEYIKDASFRLTILVSNVDYPTKGGHLTSPDTQTNWNGIIGKLCLYIYDDIYISSMKTYPDISNNSLKLVLTTINNTDAEQTHEVTASYAPINNEGTTGGYIGSKSLMVVFPVGTSKSEYIYECPDMKQWSEYNPIPYDLMLTIPATGETIHTITGMRKFSTTETTFLINDTETFLRGKHDGLIFPLTGAVPTTVSEWLRVMGISKSYGINHYRFHTCCPPDAAFTAADLLGIYMEPQLPFWGTLTAPDDENHNAAEQDYLIEEGFRMLDAFGNHPSFCMMSLGNELWGSKERMAEIIRGYRACDDRHLYTQGSNNFQHTPLLLPEDDFFVGVRFAKNRLIRGSYGMCDAPLGHIQWDEPSTDHNYDKDIYPSNTADTESNDAEEIEIQYGTGVKKVRAAKGDGVLVPHIPVVTHEIGQFAVYPDFREIDKYTGVLKARNFEVFQERLAEKGMLDLADDFFYTSGKLSVACYKEELEAAARSKLVAGYQILDIQDFSGQGTALVGILDAFMDNKGHVTPDEWNEFCSDGILLAQFNSYIYKAGDTMSADMAIRYYNPQKLAGAKLHYELAKITDYGIDASDRKNAGKGKPYTIEAPAVSGSIDIPDGIIGLHQLGTVTLSIPSSDTSAAYMLTLSVPGTAMKNHYEIYAYAETAPDVLEVPAITCSETNEVIVTSCFDEAEKALADGKRVLYMPNEVADSIEGFYCTDFWCYPMFRDICEWMKKPVAIGTMGLMIDTEHPAVKNMLSHKYCTPQWYQIISHADCAILDDVTDQDYRPILQMVDNFERNHKLGILFEGNALNGQILICTSRLSEIKDRIEARQFAASIKEYVASDAFKPSKTLDFAKLRKVFLA